MKSSDIQHQGIVKSINNNIIKVNIIGASACSACHAKKECVLSEVRTKTIDISGSSGNFSVGESVNVVLGKSMGYKAMFLGYIVPFLILLVALIVISTLTGNEAAAGIIAILVLIPYYGILYFFQKKIQQAFKFRIEKI